jgi:hypothetical protein
MNIMKFITKNSSYSTLHIGYKEKYIVQTVNANFPGLQIDIHINIEQMIPKLSGACYAARSMVHISNINILKSIYYVYFNSVIKHGKIFGGHFSNSEKLSLYKRNS